MSAGPLQSSNWYRIARLRPSLVGRARLHRHLYRGERWYLLQDPATGRVHRFSPAARLIIAAMDGRRTVDEIWRLTQRELGEAAPTQDEVLRLLGQLHGADLLQTDVTPDAAELFERGRNQARAKGRRSWANPMAMRIPLVDPGAFLNRYAPLWRQLWGRPGALAWLLVVLPALVLLPAHWPELTGSLSDRALAPDNLLLLVVVFPLIKVLHELGHATATRAGGGEVHDMGVMLLVLMPIPYVDASAASVLRSRWARARVGAAGMLVELFIAALAFYLWLAVEPGFVRALCFNVMLVAGVSTLVFNGNPLLRYDAYYILADLVEMPNLSMQATAYWGYLAQRYMLRLPDVASPVASAAEGFWLALYGVASTAYRLLVTVVIALFVGSSFFFFGVLLALWSIVAMAVLPVVRMLRSLNRQPSLREHRGRVAVAAAGVLLAVTLFLLFVPVSLRTQAEGVLWLPEQALVRAGASGFVARFEVAPGSTVRKGQDVVRSQDPALEAQIRVARARVAEMEATYLQAFATDLARAELAARQLELEREALDAALQRARDLVATAAADGVFTAVRPADAVGRHYSKGELLGYVIGEARPVVRVAVEQAEANLVAAETRSVAVRLADDLSRVWPSRILRQVPAATEDVPSGALLTPGGGRVAADLRDSQGRKALERIFVIDLELVQPMGRVVPYGLRAHVRFDHQPQPLAVQWFRSLRRLFLSHFST